MLTIEIPILYFLLCFATITGYSDKEPSSPLVEWIRLTLFDSIIKYFPLPENGTDKGNASIDHCTSDLIYFATSLKEQWALKMLDSIGKPEPGILDGSLIWTGSYDECLDVSAPRGLFSSGFTGKYCWLTFNNTIQENMSFPLNVGFCLPNSCDSNQLLKLYHKLGWILGKIPLVSNVVQVFQLKDINCASEPGRWSTSAIGYFILLAFVVSIVILATFFDLMSRPTPISKRESDECSIFHESNIANESKALLLHASFDTCCKRKNSKNDVHHNNNFVSTNRLSRSHHYRDILLCFSAAKNGSNLLSMSTKSGELNCIHGIRFLSITWVVLGHTFNVLFANISNPLQSVKIVDSLSFQAVLKGYFAVDSFLLLSGFLLTYLFLKAPKSPQNFGQWIYFYAHRYIRLTPVYAVLLFFWVNIYIYLTSGPFSNLNSKPNELRNCHAWWWTNILYINNFFASSNMCMEWSWYLSVDMQLFIISPLFLVSLKRWPIIGISLTSITLVASWLVTFLLAYENNFIVLNKESEGVDDFLHLLNFSKGQERRDDAIYTKPYCRIGPFLVGVLLGYLLKTTDRRRSIPKCIVALFWIISTICGFYLVYGIYHVKLGIVSSAFYESLSKSAWALSLGWIIYACLSGYGGPVNSLLSLKYFFPLSRLTYCVYLIHLMVIGFYSSMLKDTLYPSLITGIMLYLAFLLLSYGLAFLVTLFIEMPVIALEKQLRKAFT